MTPGGAVKPGVEGRGSLAIVLHTHMPYVYGYGTWPAGEEWLWEVVATSYLPICDLVEAGAPLTLSLTPVLADQLEAGDASARCLAFINGHQRAGHEEDVRWLAQNPSTAGEVAAARHSLERYARATQRIRAGLGPMPAGDPSGPPSPHLLAPLARAATWTSSATHAVLPLLATEAGLRLQVATGAASHRRRCGGWGGGFWLPECAWSPQLEAGLAGEGVRTVCVEVAGDDPRAPWVTPGGLHVLPIDRPLVDAVWHTSGYPSHGSYRDSHRRSYNNVALWANDGAPYDAERGRAQARSDAADFAGRCAARLDAAGGADLVVAFDTELFGHWWHEGPWFLEALIDELARAGVELQQADQLGPGAGDWPPGEAPAAGTWGRNRDLSTWSSPAVAQIAWELRRAEIDVLTGPAHRHVSEATLRDLLVLQSSDWAFMVSEGRVPHYAWQRFAEHHHSVRRPSGALPSSDPRLRHLAPDLVPALAAMG